MICTRCGQQNPDESRFCSHCGAQLHGAAGEGVPAASETVPDMSSDMTTVIGSGYDDNGELPDEADQVDALDALPAGSALLVVKRGPNAGSRFMLDQDVTTAGRHPDSDIFLDDVTVSRRHAEFRRTAAEFAVHDVGSLNGTYVNRERIDSATLTGGDEVQIGKFRLVFLAGADAGEHAEESRRTS